MTPTVPGPPAKSQDLWIASLESERLSNSSCQVLPKSGALLEGGIGRLCGFRRFGVEGFGAGIVQGHALTPGTVTDASHSGTHVVETKARRPGCTRYPCIVLS